MVQPKSTMFFWLPPGVIKGGWKIPTNERFLIGKSTRIGGFFIAIKNDWQLDIESIVSGK